MMIYAALITIAAGMIGVLGAKRLGRLAAFASIGSMGTLLIAIAGFRPETTAAAIYYMLHSTFAAALLFLVVDLVRERRGDMGGALRPGPRMAHHGLIAALFFGAAIASAGMPPLSGFIGKLLVLDAVRDMAEVWLIWAVILATSLVAVLGFAQAGSMVFWNLAPATDDAPQEAPAPQPALPIVAVCAMLGVIIALSVLAGPMMGYIDATATQLHAPDGYIAAVLGTN